MRRIDSDALKNRAEAPKIPRTVQPHPIRMLKLVKNPPRKKTIEEQMQQEPEREALRLQDVIRLMGDSAANGDKNDPVVFSGVVETQMRQVIAQYGFERLPFTYGELFGLLDYCDALDCASGINVFPTEHLAIWQEKSFQSYRRARPELFPAVELFAAQDLEALKKLHRDEDTLKKLGRKFSEFEHDE